jgi:hypothetical protein
VLFCGGRSSEITIPANVTLTLEYEATCRLAEHRSAAGLDAKGLDLESCGHSSRVSPAAKPP